MPKKGKASAVDPKNLIVKTRRERGANYLLIVFKIVLFVTFFMSFIPQVVVGIDFKKLHIGVKKRPPDCPIKSSKGDLIHVHYTGTLQDGTEFDNSFARGTPMTFTLGSDQVIKGWEQGLIGMCEGEERKLIIPADLAYGASGAPPKIPTHAPLIFQLQLVKIEKRKDEF